MNLCDDGHDEVCYEGKICPVCDKVEEIERLQEANEKLRDEIKSYEEV